MDSTLKLLLVIMLILPGAAAYAAGDYLNALEEEAEVTGKAGVVEPSQGSASPAKPKANVSSGDSITSGLSFDEFETELEVNFSGSHFLYVRLKKSKRKAVYDFYQGNNEVEPIRKEIVRQLSSG